MSEDRDLTADEMLAALFQLALNVAQERGLQVTDNARVSGPYAFMAEVRRTMPGLRITRADLPKTS
ncbi:hypothetical protein [Streptomyces sp. NPDC088752]|uniref:hypothetical protein n=1 Tax=Streptomyces sp. NPDC088752 TaxID=3154963 RepID=UPI00343B84F6